MPNQFYIQPAGNISRPLSGLSEMLRNVGEQRKANELAELQSQQMEDAKAAVTQAMRSGDPNTMREAAVQYPDYMDQLNEAAEAETGVSNDERVDFTRKLVTAANEEEVRALYEQRIQDLTDRGRDPRHTERSYQEFLANPKGKRQEMIMAYAAMDPEGYDAYKEMIAGPDDSATVAMQTLEGRAAAAGLTAGTPEYQTFMRYGGAPPAGPQGDQRDRKIADYQDLFGMTVEEATRRVDARPMMDDLGNLTTFDPTTGTSTITPVNRGTPPDLVDAPQGTAVEDLAFDPGAGTGFGASAMGLWNSTFGQLPFLPIGRDAAEAAQNLRVLERDAISALASSGRPPVVEQERIAAIIPRAMDPFQNPEEAQYKMTNFIDLMMNQYVDDMRYSQDRNNPREVRETSAGRARRIESIVRRVLEPEAARFMFESLERVEGEIGEIRSMPMSELESLDPSTLTDSQLDIYIERLQGN